MRIRVGLENGNEGRSIAWALDYPGCFAYGVDGSEALIHLLRALLKYQEWIESHTAASWVEIGDFDIRLVETFDVYTIDQNFELSSEGYEVNAFFRDDWRPLSQGDIERGLMMLRWSRADFLESVRDMPQVQLDRTYEGERWSIRGILKHVANAENWYLDRFDMAIPVKPEGALERLAAVRDHLEAVLPSLAGKELVIGRDGEIWSPRKLLRRCLWHERDHSGHIHRLALS
jgi:hypothetical protein